MLRKSLFSPCLNLYPIKMVNKMEILNENSAKKSLNNVTVGDGVKIYDFVNAYGCTIGAGTKVGTFVEIQRGAFIGKHCKNFQSYFYL